MEASHPLREFNICALGHSGTGKTSLLQTLTGVPFNRKTGHKSSMEDEPTRYSVEATTSAGLLLFHFHDWAWEEKRRDQNINQQLMRGRDGALFLYDVTDRRSKTDFVDYSDWYQRAAGFEKPWLIVSNKNDQKKKAVQDGEGQALARQGDKRAYVALSLVENTGVEDVVVGLARLLMQDLNLTVASFGKASESSMNWSDEKLATTSAGLGLGGLGPKSKRVILVVMNRAVIEKFEENLSPSIYSLEPVGNADECEALLTETQDTEGKSSSDTSLPIYAIIVPPTASDSQQKTLDALAKRFNIGFVVSVPRSALDALSSL